MAAPRKKKTRTQPNLSAERIRDEALRLIEEDGLEELSTRKLGRALGVEAMAIYWYYPSKDALLDAVVDTLVAKLGAPAAEPSAPPPDFLDALRSLARAYRGLARRYPNAFPLLATRRFATETTYRFLNDLFTLAEAHGLDAHATARYYRLIASYCSGAALNELAALREAEAEDASARAARATYPRLAKVWDWLGPKHFDDVFEFGLELLLSSVRTAIEGTSVDKRPARPRRRS